MGRIHRHAFDLLHNPLGVSFEAFSSESTFFCVCTYVHRTLLKALPTSPPAFLPPPMIYSPSAIPPFQIQSIFLCRENLSGQVSPLWISFILHCNCALSLISRERKKSSPPSNRQSLHVLSETQMALMHPTSQIWASRGIHHPYDICIISSIRKRAFGLFLFISQLC